MRAECRDFWRRRYRLAYISEAGVDAVALVIFHAAAGVDWPASFAAAPPAGAKTASRFRAAFRHSHASSLSRVCLYLLEIFATTESSDAYFRFCHRLASRGAMPGALTSVSISALDGDGVRL